MPNYHKLNIQNLALKMLDGDNNAKNQIIEHYIKYINTIIETNFNNFDCDKEALKNEMLKIMYESIETYNEKQNIYFSHYITRKIIPYYSNELRKLNNKQEYKNREIQKLAMEMVNGDINALNKIIEFYTFHITKLVNEKYANVSYEKEDLIQIGIIGLLKAIDLYKESQEHPFSNYANSYIKKEIESELKLTNKTPNIEYVGLINNYNTRSFNSFLENAEIKEAIKKLSFVKRKVLFLHLYGKCSFDDIGNILGFSHQRAHEHYKCSIELIKEELNLTSEKQKKL